MSTSAADQERIRKLEVLIAELQARIKIIEDRPRAGRPAKR